MFRFAAHTDDLFHLTFADAPLIVVAFNTPGYAPFGRLPGVINIRHLQCRLFLMTILFSSSNIIMGL